MWKWVRWGFVDRPRRCRYGPLMPNTTLLPPVKQRVRVSARISRDLDARLQAELHRRRAAGELGGASTAELVAVAVAELAAKDPEGLRRAYRQALPVAGAPQQVHLQPRIAPELAEYVDVAAHVLRNSLGERRATRRHVIVAAIHGLLPQ